MNRAPRSRRRRTQSLRERAKEDAQALLSRQPFSGLGQMLVDYLRLTDHYSAEDDDALRIALWFLDRFPSADTPQLEFDLLLIQQLLAGVMGNQVELSPTVIPSYSLNNEWGYEKRGLPVGDRYYYLMAFVYFPRSGGETPQLDHYMWLVHELFHHLWSQIKTRFAHLYQPVFEGVLFEYELSTLADRALAQQKSRALRKQLAGVWQLGDTGGWPLEIAIDALCLYVSGPAYLGAFAEAHSAHTAVDPYLIDAAHPPIELRASALLVGAASLDWYAHTDELVGLLERWRNQDQEASVKNYYDALRSDPLITACVESALAVAADINLPRLTTSDLQRLERAVAAGEALEGLDLIVAAQLYTRSLDEATLLAWEERAVKQLLGDAETP